MSELSEDYGSCTSHTVDMCMHVYLNILFPDIPKTGRKLTTELRGPLTGKWFFKKIEGPAESNQKESPEVKVFPLCHIFH